MTTGPVTTARNAPFYVALGVVGLAVLGDAAVSYHSLNALAADDLWVRHSLEVRERIGALRAAVSSAQDDADAWRADHDPQSLSELKDDERQIDADLDALADAVRG